MFGTNDRECDGWDDYCPHCQKGYSFDVGMGPFDCKYCNKSLSKPTPPEDPEEVKNNLASSLLSLADSLNDTSVVTNDDMVDKTILLQKAQIKLEFYQKVIHELCD